MKFPVVISEYNTIIVVDEDVFHGIGTLDLAQGQIELNAGSQGLGSIKWILDSNGCFYSLEYLGEKDRTVLQKIGLMRPREKFAISPGRSISAGELLKYVEPLKDKYEEAPNVTDLRAALAELPADHVISEKEMRKYVGSSGTL